MIRFLCPSCRMALRVREERAGRRVLCPFCRRSSTVPAASEDPAATAGGEEHFHAFVFLVPLVVLLLGLFLWWTW